MRLTALLRIRFRIWLDWLFICKRILSAFRPCSWSSPWPPQDTHPRNGVKEHRVAIKKAGDILAVDLHLVAKQFLTTLFKKSQEVRQKLELPGQGPQAIGVVDGLCGSDAHSGRSRANPENQRAGIDVTRGRWSSRLG